MDEKIIDVQGVKLSDSTIEALIQLQRSSLDNCFVSDIDRMSRFLLNASISMDLEDHKDMLFCLQILALIRDCFIDLGIGKNSQDE